MTLHYEMTPEKYPGTYTALNENGEKNLFIKTANLSDNPHFTPSVRNNELEIFASMPKHPNIVQCYGSFPQGNSICIVMEYCQKGSLLQHIMKKRIGEKQCLTWMKHLTAAVKHCHDNGIIHCDIKPENVVIDAKGTAKLCDFGLSEKKTPGRKLRGGGGSHCYISPERVRKQPFAEPADMWSLGVTLYTMTYRKNPFKGPNIHSTYENIKKMRFVGNEKLPNLSSHAGKIISSLLKKDPEERARPEQVLRYIEKILSCVK